MQQVSAMPPPVFRDDIDAPPQSGDSRTSVVLFILIAALMATDLTIEFYRGVSWALHTCEVLLFVSALAVIAFHWWKRFDERRRSRYLDRELAAACAEAHR